ncbi:MAG: hypothetical protein LT102_02110 [Burkholderiaceae bacterium]|nr:hypothetical protein [Burkholderiaceae bacterium]
MACAVFRARGASSRIARRLLFALAFALVGACAHDFRLSQEIDAADFVLGPSRYPPPDSADWQLVPLPDAWEISRPGAHDAGWYRFEVDLADEPDEPWLAYFPRLRDGGMLYVNGALAATVPQSDATQFVQWLRPHAPAIPPRLLHAGTNVFHLRVSTSGSSFRMVPFFVGPESELNGPYQWRLFWSYTSAQMTVIATVLLGVFVLVIWVRRRMSFEYGLFGLAALCWGIRTLILVVSVFPARFWHLWQTLNYAATGGFVVSMTLFMLRFAGLRNTLIERSLLAYWLTGPLAMLFGGEQLDQAVGRYYQGGLIVVSTLMLAATAVAGWRNRTPGVLMLCIGVVFGLALGVHDYLIQIGVLDYRRPYLLHLSATVLLGAVGALLADRFVRSLRDAEQAARVLESTVRDREVELERNYERLRRLERERVLGEERQRIMQDMHDGLGSHLLSSLAMIERGAVDPDAIAQALREAIDDMRLAIDTLSPAHEGLGEALANLSWRLQPRFAAAGIALRFHLDELPDRIDLPVEESLQVLRVLQEALTNALKHSGARQVDVFLDVHGEPARLALRIRDDGTGFEVGQSHGGRGLSGMRRRARRLGAGLQVHSGPGGSLVSLEVRLSMPGGISPDADAAAR